MANVNVLSAFCERARLVIDNEAQAVAALVERLGSTFDEACEVILACQGRVVVTGMGKSGHIGHKIAATLASTGTPAFFMHPGEAGHGDLGMITSQDVVIAISNSGETPEILTILPLIKRYQIPLIGLTGASCSTLAKTSNVVLDVGVKEEACPLNLAPTSSTTVTLVMGDALAIALLEARGFTAHDFALSHPGGSLGRRLIIRVADIMHTGTATPKILCNTLLRDALMEVSQKRLGMTAVVNDEDYLLGVFTDGDLRRTLALNIDIHNITVDAVMTKTCTTITPDVLAAEALQLMETRRINALPVINAEGQLVGALNMHDILRAGIA